MAGGRAESPVDEDAADGDDSRGTKALAVLFSSCATDPKGAVHRTWGVALIFIAVFFVSAIIEVVGISNSGGPIALAIAAGLCGIVQLAAAVTGTFVLKRFPTRFSVGFFLGLIVIISQQCLIAFVAFGGRHVEEDGRNSLVFANISLALFLVYGVFALMLVHFREHIVLAPIDVGTIARKGKGGEGDAGSLGEGASYDNFEER